MKILVITLSNIGDAVLTTGVIEALRAKFPKANLDLVVGDRAKDVFSHDNRIDKIYPYKKNIPLLNKFKFFLRLRSNKYNLVVDLKNIFAAYFISLRPLKSSHIKAHVYLKHNMALRRFFTKAELKDFKPKVLWASEDKVAVESFMLRDYIVVSAIAKSLTKSWPLEYFRELIAMFLKDYPDLDVVLTGSGEEESVLESLVIDSRVKNLSNKTTIPQLAYLIKEAEVVITNDSASLHLASSVNTPTVAIFGPTSSDKYGPLSDGSVILKRSYICSPCERSQCLFFDKRCLSSIKPEYVLKILKRVLDKIIYKNSTQKYKRILLSRTDRMGDLILTTSVIEVVREYFPDAYICFLASSKLMPIIKDNPYIDGIVGLDKDKEHKGIFGFLKLLRKIRKKKFDLIINFHPTNRNHILAFLSGIKERVGYDLKLGILNNLRVKHDKQRGEMKEAEYNFNLLRKIGIDKVSLKQYLKPDKSALEWIDNDLESKNITRFAVIHPGASCKSKLWELGNFIELSRRIKAENDLDVVFVLGPEDRDLERRLSENLDFKFSLYFSISLERLIALISRASFMISNDSGPMHIADSLNKPLITIFGRNQAGLSYKRWGPMGENAKVVYEDPDCKECLAHNCDKEFICLRNITVDRVYNEFKDMFSRI